MVILVVCGPFEIDNVVHGFEHWRTDLPLQICDFAWLVAAVVLLTRDVRWAALLYFWGLTLSLQGVLTPDLGQVFPDPQFFGFWVRHLTPVWVAVYLVGARAGPSWRGYRLAVAVTALWAATMMTLNAVLGSNYGFLNAKPTSHSLLDFLGPVAVVRRRRDGHRRRRVGADHLALEPARPERRRGRRRTGRGQAHAVTDDRAVRGALGSTGVRSDQSCSTSHALRTTCPSR